MTSERLGEMFKCDISARVDGGTSDGQECADGERGHPSERAEITICFIQKLQNILRMKYQVVLCLLSACLSDN